MEIVWIYIFIKNNNNIYYLKYYKDNELVEFKSRGFQDKFVIEKFQDNEGVYYMIYEHNNDKYHLRLYNNGVVKANTEQFTSKVRDNNGSKFTVTSNYYDFENYDISKSIEIWKIYIYNDFRYVNDNDQPEYFSYPLRNEGKGKEIISEIWFIFA